MPDESKSRKLIKIGAVVLIVGYVPILLYVLFGPANGNPIGLGLLMVAANFVGIPLVLAGVAVWLWKIVSDKR